jgi:hypothetical protein
MMSTEEQRRAFAVPQESVLPRSIDAAAWFVNWVCVVMIFLGLVMLGHDMRENSAMRAKQMRVLEAHMDKLIKDMAVRPSDVLPHVLRVEKLITEGCAITTAAGQ